MKTTKTLLIATLLAILVSGLAYAQDAPVEFSASLQVDVYGQPALTGRIHVRDSLVRTDLPDEVAIYRPDKGLLWLIFEARKGYIETPLVPAMLPQVGRALPGEVSREFLYDDQFDGRAIKKYRVITGPDTGSMSYYIWIANDLGFIVRVASTDGSWGQSYTKLELSPPSRALFDLPAGYRKLSEADMTGEAAPSATTPPAQ